MILRCGHQHIGQPCDYCAPCSCDCHRNENVYHFMACCGICSECGQQQRKQFDSPESREKRQERNGSTG